MSGERKGLLWPRSGIFDQEIPFDLFERLALRLRQKQKDAKEVNDRVQPAMMPKSTP